MMRENARAVIAMLIQPIKTRVFKEGEPLLPFVVRHAKKVKNGSIIVITSKIVALSEGRVRRIKDAGTRARVIKSESQWRMRTKHTWLTIKDNMVMASAGVDESNADGKLILLPKNSFAAARRIREELKRHYRIKNLGVIITDSRLLPLRAGIVGVALGYSGFGGIRDYRGTPDIFGRILRLSRTDVADSLATAAVLMMGEGAERQPLAVIKNAPVEFKDKTDPRELFIDPREDIYQPLFEKIKKAKWPGRRA